MDLVEGASYVVEGLPPGAAFLLFRSLAERGMPALCLTRQYPVRMLRALGTNKIAVLWLAEAPGDDRRNPNALGALAREIEAFIEARRGRAVVLLDGVEYLVAHNGFLQVLRFIERLNEFVMRRKAILLMPVDPRALGRRETAQLERDSDVLLASDLLSEREEARVRRELGD